MKTECKNKMQASEPSSSSPTWSANDKQRALQDQPPPMSVVVIQESLAESPLACGRTAGQYNEPSWAPPPPSSVISTEGGESTRESAWQVQQQSRSSVIGRGSSHEKSVLHDSAPLPPPPSGFSSFKLKPRDPSPFVPSSSPSRPGRGVMGGAARGRKRPANSISIPVGSLCPSATAESSPLLLRPPRPAFDSKGEDRSDGSAAKQRDSTSPGSELSHYKDSPRSPPVLEMECLQLKSLSLQSPSSKASPPSYGSRTYGSQHGGGANLSSSSSFQMYGPSPSGSVTRAPYTSTSTSESSSSVVARTPCSSTMSSPRHVPLTVLSPGGQNWMSPSKNSLVRPPLHGSGASLLFSLDNSTEDSDDEFVGSPRSKPPRAPPSSTNSSISSEESERKEHSFHSPSTRAMPLFTSPVKTTTALSPKTPLPRIMLTPRTPQSSGGRPHKVGLPMFPSPSEDDIYSTVATTPLTRNSSIDEAMDSLLGGFAMRGGLYPTAEGHFPPATRYISPSSAKTPKKFHDSSNSLAYSMAFSVDDNNAGGATEGPSSPPSSDDIAKKTSALSTKAVVPPPVSSLPACYQGLRPPQRAGKSTDVGPAPVHQKVSSNAPSHNDILRAMMEENARARAAHADTCSLSDSCCEEDAFVLTCPLSTQSNDVDDGNQRPRQRRRDSYDSISLSTSRFQGGKESCTSLTSGMASASSLFGMEISQDEVHSAASPMYSKTTPYSSHSLKSKNSLSGGTLNHKDNENFGTPALGMQRHRTHKSEQSFSSLGLNLDGPASSSPSLEEQHQQQGRDLTTPPVTRHIAFTPPPLPSAQYQPAIVHQPHAADSSFCPTPKSCTVETKTSPRAIEV